MAKIYLPSLFCLHKKQKAELTTLLFLLKKDVEQHCEKCGESGGNNVYCIVIYQRKSSVFLCFLSAVNLFFKYSAADFAPEFDLEERAEQAVEYSAKEGGKSDNKHLEDIYSAECEG